MASHPLPPVVSFNDEAKTRLFQAKYARLFTEGSGPVLDIGCGQGVFLELLRDRDVDAVGVDHSEEAFMACRRKGLNMRKTDAFSFLTENGYRFDGIFASHFIEHFSPPDTLRLFELCHNSLKPKGLLAVVTPNTADLTVMTQWFWLDPTHVRPYPLELVKSLFNQAGFMIETAGEDRQTALARGKKQRAVDILRRITTLGLAGRGDIFVVGRKRAE